MSQERLCHGCHKTFLGSWCNCYSGATSEPFDRSQNKRVFKTREQELQESQDRADRAFNELKSFVRANT